MVFLYVVHAVLTLHLLLLLAKDNAVPIVCMIFVAGYAMACRAGYEIRDREVR